MEIFIEPEQIFGLKLLTNLEDFKWIRNAHISGKREPVYNLIAKVIPRLRRFEESFPILTKLIAENEKAWEQYSKKFGTRIFSRHYSELKITPTCLIFSYILKLNNTVTIEDQELGREPTYKWFEVCNCINVDTNEFEYVYIIEMEETYEGFIIKS
ncbi:MAG: hypothetical protein KAS32_05780 [Candidatus Peribacteraceae bacterium]|nr:hypothetical protein [Candidatus Peribacteraceae bacterium]